MAPSFEPGIVLRALGIPVSMYTVLFAIARTPGWMSQWKELASEPAHKISRPRQIYTGALGRTFVPVAARPVNSSTGAPRAADGDGLHHSLLSRLVSTHGRPAGR